MPPSIFDILDARSKNFPDLPSDRYSYKLAGGYGLDTPVVGDLDVDPNDMSMNIYIADGSNKDSVGDVIEIGGIKTHRHVSNPIILYDHGKEITLPIARARKDPKDVNSYSVTLDAINKKAWCRAFFYQGENECALTGSCKPGTHAKFCQELFDMAYKGFVSAGSLGYQIIHGTPIGPDYSSGTPQGIHLHTTLLLEGSLVVLPANERTVGKNDKGIQILDYITKALTGGRINGEQPSEYFKKAFTPYLPQKKVQTISGYDSKSSGQRVPNYRKADDPEESCQTCGAFMPHGNQFGHCNMFDILVDPEAVCDRWYSKVGEKAMQHGPNCKCAQCQMKYGTKDHSCGCKDCMSGKACPCTTGVKHIRHEKGRESGHQWVLYNHDMTKVLGTHPSKDKAEAQERAVEAHKHGKAFETTHPEDDLDVETKEEERDAPKTPKPKQNPTPKQTQSSKPPRAKPTTTPQTSRGLRGKRGVGPEYTTDRTVPTRFGESSPEEFPTTHTQQSPQEYESNVVGFPSSQHETEEERARSIGIDPSQMEEFNRFMEHITPLEEGSYTTPEEADRAELMGITPSQMQDFNNLSQKVRELDQEHPGLLSKFEELPPEIQGNLTNWYYSHVQDNPDGSALVNSISRLNTLHKDGKSLGRFYRTKAIEGGDAPKPKKPKQQPKQAARGGPTLTGTTQTQKRPVESGNKPRKPVPTSGYEPVKTERLLHSSGESPSPRGYDYESRFAGEGAREAPSKYTEENIGIGPEGLFPHKVSGHGGRVETRYGEGFPEPGQGVGDTENLELTQPPKEEQAQEEKPIPGTISEKAEAFYSRLGDMRDGLSQIKDAYRGNKSSYKKATYAYLRKNVQPYLNKFLKDPEFREDFTGKAMSRYLGIPIQLHLPPLKWKTSRADEAPTLAGVPDQMKELVNTLKRGLDQYDKTSNAMAAQEGNEDVATSDESERSFDQGWSAVAGGLKELGKMIKEMISRGAGVAQIQKLWNGISQYLSPNALRKALLTGSIASALGISTFLADLTIPSFISQVSGKSMKSLTFSERGYTWDSKSLKDLIDKHRTAEGRYFRSKHSIPGAIHMTLSRKDLDGLRDDAETKGVEVNWISDDGQGYCKVRLMGMDGVLEDLAKKYAKAIKKVKSFPAELGDKVGPIGTLPGRSRSRVRTGDQYLQHSPGGTDEDEDTSDETPVMTSRGVKAMKKTITVEHEDEGPGSDLQSNPKGSKHKQGDGGVQGANGPIGEEVPGEDYTPGAEEASLDSGDYHTKAEPYGAQVLRRIHQDMAGLIHEYDEFLDQTEDNTMREIVMKQIHHFIDSLEELEDTAGSHERYKDLFSKSPLEGAAGAEGKQLAMSGTSGIGHDSEMEDEDDPNKVLGGMQTQEDPRAEPTPKETMEGMAPPEDEEEEMKEHYHKHIKNLRLKHSKQYDKMEEKIDKTGKHGHREEKSLSEQSAFYMRQHLKYLGNNTDAESKKARSFFVKRLKAHEEGKDSETLLQGQDKEHRPNNEEELHEGMDVTPVIPGQKGKKAQPSDNISKDKARQMLKDGTARGHPLTDKQHNMLEAAAHRGE